ncbi:MAG TPA: thioesterase family protein [Blastocatellia bacterium]|nr:thioesterase family protein [Blastocatellia bacterium]
MHELLAEFPVIIELPVAWGEMDAYGVVNNSVYFRYFESARMEYFERLGLSEYKERTGIGAILASTQARFKMPLTYPDKVLVGTRITNIETDRFTMEYRVVSRRAERIAAEGSCVVVTYDYLNKTKAQLPLEIKARIDEIELHSQQST